MIIITNVSALPVNCKSCKYYDILREVCVLLNLSEFEGHRRYRAKRHPNCPLDYIPDSRISTWCSVGSEVWYIRNSSQSGNDFPKKTRIFAVVLKSDGTKRYRLEAEDDFEFSLQDLFETKEKCMEAIVSGVKSRCR